MEFQNDQYFLEVDAVGLWVVLFVFKTVGGI